MTVSKLPALPGCGRPATTRIEIYSPRKTLHGSLDGSIYTCREHTDPARDAINAAGLTPHTMPVGEGPKFCGDGYDFLAGRELYAPDPPADNPPTITPEQALAQVIDKDRAREALLHRIATQITDEALSPDGDGSPEPSPARPVPPARQEHGPGTPVPEDVVLAWHFADEEIVKAGCYCGTSPCTGSGA